MSLTNTYISVSLEQYNRSFDHNTVKAEHRKLPRAITFAAQAHLVLLCSWTVRRSLGRCLGLGVLFVDYIGRKEMIFPVISMQLKYYKAVKDWNTNNNGSLMIHSDLFDH